MLSLVRIPPLPESLAEIVISAHPSECNVVRDLLVSSERKKYQVFHCQRAYRQALLCACSGKQGHDELGNLRLRRSLAQVVLS